MRRELRAAGAVLPWLLALAASGQSASAGIQFTNRSEAAGITIRTTNGDPESPYIIDSLGSGVALFDFDNDGDLDIYVVNGSRLESFPAGKEPMAALYRNDGHGRFTDVTAGSGLAVPFW